MDPREKVWHERHNATADDAKARREEGVERQQVPTTV